MLICQCSYIFGEDKVLPSYWILRQENFLAAGVILKAAVVAIMEDHFLATAGKFKKQSFMDARISSLY